MIADPGGRRIDADRVVALPALVGRGVEGIPADGDGFIPVDAYGRVAGLPGVFAAGDGTNFPIKQGGLATQQADAVAEAIAGEVGAPVEPEPFRPVLRGLKLTGGDDRFSATRSPAAGARARSPATRCGGRRPRSRGATSLGICSVGDMALAWALTIPATALLGGLMLQILGGIA